MAPSTRTARTAEYQAQVGKQSKAPTEHITLQQLCCASATIRCPVPSSLPPFTIHPTPTRPEKKQNNHDRSLNLRIPLLLQQPSAPHAAAAYGAGKCLRNSPPCSLSACSATNLGRHHGPAREPDSALHRQLLRRHARRHVRRVLSLSGLCGDIPAQAVLPAPI